MKQLTLISLLILLTGCLFQKPDYVSMIRIAELHRILGEGDVFLVDVSIPEQQLHIIKTDLAIPFNEVEKYQHLLPKNKNMPIFLYGTNDAMGNIAARSLYDMGYHRLYNLIGGSEVWKKIGLELE